MSVFYLLTRFELDRFINNGDLLSDRKNEKHTLTNTFTHTHTNTHSQTHRFKHIHKEICKDFSIFIRSCAAFRSVGMSI